MNKEKKDFGIITSFVFGCLFYLENKFGFITGMLIFLVGIVGIALLLGYLITIL